MTPSRDEDITEALVPTRTSTDHGGEQGVPRQRGGGGFVSRHRVVLDRIATDATRSKRYPVPETTGAADDGASSSRRSSVVGGIMSRCGRSIKESLSIEDKSCNEWIELFLPCWSWLRTYDIRECLPSDFTAGMTVGVMIIPQSMSYAKLAGLPVQYGLYSALFPVYAYAFFGTSRQLGIGPVALISLLLSTGLDTILENSGLEGDEYDAEYQRLAVQISFLVGVMYIFMGLAQLGFVTIFLSHAVISGFTTGAAVIIGMSQVKYIFGVDADRSDRFHEVLKYLIVKMDEFNWKTFVMGMESVILLVVFKNLGKKYKSLKWLRALGPLIVTTITIVLTVTLDLKNRGVPIVGDIPSGFPKLTVNDWTPIKHFGQLFVVVISITIVGFMESIAIAKQLASKHKYEIDSSLELIGLGMANLAGGAFGAYPVTGSFSRSAVNNESGAKSTVSSMVTATMVAVVLLLLTPVFELMPLCTLAAIVISGVLGLLDYEEAIHLYHVHKFDFSVWMVACTGTLFLGVEIGLAIAVAVSMLIVIYESAYPHTAVLGRLPGTSIYRNVKQYPEAEKYDGIVLVRIDAPLYFANAQNVRDKVRKYRLSAQSELEATTGGDVKYLILEMSPVSHIDTSALHILDDMVVTYLARGQQICFSNPGLNVMERMVSSGFVDKVGREHFFTCLHDAVHWCLQEMDCEAVSIHESSQGDRNNNQNDTTVDMELDDVAEIPNGHGHGHDDDDDDEEIGSGVVAEEAKIM